VIGDAPQEVQGLPGASCGSRPAEGIERARLLVSGIRLAYSAGVANDAQIPQGAAGSVDSAAHEGLVATGDD
jgi:hypothetical protein